MRKPNEELPDERDLPEALDASIDSDSRQQEPGTKKQRTETHAESGSEPAAAPVRRPARKRASAKRADSRSDSGTIVKMRQRKAVDERADKGESELRELAAQGFTPDEAQRLLHISDRLSTSHEAREAEATLRRLRFTRWLIEHGMLDEFSA